MVFPNGFERVGFFEEAKRGSILKVFFDTSRNSYSFDFGIIDILLWEKREVI